MKQSLHTFLTCLVKEKSESNQTPKFLTASEGISDSPNIFTGKNGFNFFCWDLEPNIIKSVLSAFSFSLFAHNHSLTSSRHFPNWSKAISAFLCVRWINSWVSSAYNEKRIGPRTEPCGTPNLSFPASERTEPILMYWVWSERYDLN